MNEKILPKSRQSLAGDAPAGFEAKGIRKWMDEAKGNPRLAGRRWGSVGFSEKFKKGVK